MPRIASDPGLTALDALYTGLMIDDEWAVRSERGFTWWSYRLAQRVEASEPSTFLDGATACKVRVWTEVVRATTATEALPSLLAAVNMQQTMSALVWDYEAETVVEAFTALVFDDTVEQWIAPMVTAALLQNTAAHSRAHGLAEAAGGVPWVSNHPDSGERPSMDDMLDVPASLADDDDGQSRFKGNLVEELDRFGPQVAVVGSGSEDTYLAEVVYSSEVPSMAAGPGEPPGTALFQVFANQDHPQLGSGALITLGLPLSFDSDQVSIIANNLNLAEARGEGEATFMGAWCPSPSQEDELCFVSFLPSILARPGVLENMFAYSAARSRWAHQILDD